MKVDSASSKPSKDAVDLAEGPKAEENLSAQKKSWFSGLWGSSAKKPSVEPSKPKYPDKVGGKRLRFSLIPRPHHKEKRSGEPTRISCNLAMFKTFSGQPASKVQIVEWRWTNFTVVRPVLHNNYWSPISLVLLLLGNDPKKFNFVHQTVSLREAHASWAQDSQRLWMCTN